MTDELRVSVGIGLTLKLAPDSYEMVKPDIRIDGIDPAGDVEAQVTASLEAAAIAVVKIDGQLEATLAQLLSPDSNSPGIREELNRLKENQRKIVERTNQIVVKLRDPQFRDALVEEVAGVAENAN